MSWVVVVSEERNPKLTENPAVSYVSPPHESLEDAHDLVALLNGIWPTGDGPWRTAIAGGRRTIELRCHEQQRSFPAPAQLQSDR